MGTSNARRLMVVSCLAVLALAAGARRPSVHHAAAPSAAAPAPSNGGVEAKVGGFARADGARFTVGGRPFYPNGFNAYWLMYMASNPGDRSKVLATLDQASHVGATVIRTWAFSDGGSNRPLQTTPGVYSEDVFVGLDFVIAEAKKRGLYLILSLVNNWGDFGGKRQYVQWAKDQGHNLGSDDDFFRDALTQQFYKEHVKRVLTRINSFTGVAYKDEPTIFAWELMNEPRVPTDPSGKTMQAWVALMSSYVKSIDDKHMVEVGLEGFYGESTPERKRFNPGGDSAGTDFIGNNRIPTVDFATIHYYPDVWLPGSTGEQQVEFWKKWMASHIEDTAKALRKPLVVAEFGWNSVGNAVTARDDYFRMVYDAIYASAKRGGPCAGGLFWQVLAPGMESWTDRYAVVLERSFTTAAIVSQEYARIGRITP
ncbi:putative mannan endo-1,4-beta-mannosidase 9 [Triticum urartu]|uniref:mannan endo-1,4-beta-mannosidase n=1 Tax=Triticum urartu TaxID=4572 RepID=A0A8R7UUQ4_TRIUA|nr:putative mannan endo-1,4-beta-mannosidase 9 [Triticum urartu]